MSVTWLRVYLWNVRTPILESWGQRSDSPRTAQARTSRSHQRGASGEWISQSTAVNNLPANPRRVSCRSLRFRWSGTKLRGLRSVHGQSEFVYACVNDPIPGRGSNHLRILIRWRLTNRLLGSFLGPRWETACCWSYSARQWLFGSELSLRSTIPYSPHPQELLCLRCTSFEKQMSLLARRIGLSSPDL